MKKVKDQKNIKKGVIGIVVTMMVTFGSYASAIAGTTVSVAESKSINADIQELQTDIAELELEFFAVVNNFSLSDAAAVGLSETQSIAYVDVDQATTVAYNIQ